MPDRIAVCNTTPFIALSKAGVMWLLKEIYGEVFVPQSVWDELTVKNDSVSAEVFSNKGWIHVVKVQNIKIRMLFSISLHAGEAETIMLADEINADVVIIDDSLARKYALQAGLNITGTIGILLKAKKASLVDAVKPLLDTMIDNGIYINKRLYSDIMVLADE